MNKMKMSIWRKIGSTGLGLAILVWLAVVFGPLGLLRTLPAHAKAVSFTESTSFPISLVVFIPCALEGAGEFVELSGELHDLFHVTLDDRGGLPYGLS